MAIDANVSYVETREDGSGTLHLCDRVPNGSRGQSRLHFDAAPYTVTSLNGLSIWGGDAQIMLGEQQIATRVGYTRIKFVSDEDFVAACVAYRRRQETQYAR